MKLTITLDNLDDAIKQLKELAEKIRQFPKDVATESMDRIGYSSTGVSYGDGENTVYAGGNGIAFEEFGAGFYAQVADFDDFHTEPGIWSADHARTFQNWQGQDYAYPYNKQPQRKMQIEAERLRNETEQKAKDYFK